MAKKTIQEIIKLHREVSAKDEYMVTAEDCMERGFSSSDIFWFAEGFKRAEALYLNNKSDEDINKKEAD